MTIGHNLRRSWIVFAGAGIVLLAGVGVAFAGHNDTNVKSYTGCLSEGGTLAVIAEGNAPAHPCPPGSSEAHFSGGDITQIVVGDGLVGGGDNGSVSISLQPGYALPQTCATGQVVTWNGTGWACTDDADTQYTAGTGLALNGNEFAVASGYRVHNDESCPNGQFATGIDGSGHLACSALPNGATSFEAKQANYLNGDGIPDDSSHNTYVSVTPTPGTYMITAKATIDSEQNISSRGSVNCKLINGATELDYVYFGPETLDTISGDMPFPLVGITTVSSGQAISIVCQATPGADGISIRAAHIVGVRVA